MIGGDLLATGSSSCIFRPNIPCKGSKDKISNKKISKIVYGSKADRYFNKEKKISKILKKIKNASKWCVYYDKFCNPPSYDNIFNYDKHILECKEKDYEQIFDKSSKMLVGKYGGITFEDYFLDNILNDDSLNKIEYVIFTLLRKMKFLFIGLTSIYDNNLVHLDIKYNNIVLDGQYFKYIDFGLSGELNDIEHFSRRSLSEFNNNRLYMWYPIEYLYLFTDSNDIRNELNNINNNKFRKHYTDLIDIHKFFNKNFNNYYKNFLLNYKSHNIKDIKNIISMIDVYSLGIMIPSLFFDYGLIKYVNDTNPFLVELFDLFKQMCELDYNNRITPDNCLKQYNLLMKKYSHLNKNKGKKTKRKKIKYN